MRNVALILILLLLLLVPFKVSSQAEIRISLLTVDIWPEYDQPAVLMIYRLTLDSGTSLPVNLVVRIPSTAQINAVAIKDSTNGLVNAPYERNVQGKWAEIKLQSNSLQVQVEYYAPLEKSGDKRHVTFEWAGDYAVDDLEMNFLKSPDAENISFSLAPNATTSSQGGAMNYLIQKANLTAGQVFSLSVDYARKTDELLISSLPVQAASTPGPDTPGRVSMNDILPWILGGIGVVLVIGGVVGFFVWQRGGQGPVKRKQHVRRQAEKEDEFTYCHQCGKRAHPGDVFCRTCGTRLKR